MAKTKGVINATDINLFVTEGVTTKKIAEITSATLSLTHSPREVTSNESGGFTARAKGKLDWEMSGNSLFRFDNAASFAMLYDLYENGTEITLTWKTGTDQAPDDNEKYYGKARITQLQATGSVEENLTISFTFAGAAKLEYEFYPESAETNIGGSAVIINFGKVMKIPTGVNVAAFQVEVELGTNPTVASIERLSNTNLIRLNLTGFTEPNKTVHLTYDPGATTVKLQTDVGLLISQLDSYPVTNLTAP